MAGMFSNLYAYRQRSDFAPLENFLTEALADVFRRLPVKLQISFALALVPPANRASLTGVFAEAKKVEIATQVSVLVGDASKRPDIILYADGRPLIVIEAKVGAGLQEHDVVYAHPQPDEERLTRHQLHTYAKWIAAEHEGEDRWPGAVIFLTAYTAPPKDFTEGYYGGAISAIRSWKNVGDWIVENIAISDKELTYCALASELRLFLKEQKLMTKYMSAHDLAAAAVFAPSASNLHRTFIDVMKAVGRHAEKLKGSRQIKAEFWGEGNIYWGWFHFAKSVKRKASKPYVAVGICFEVAEPWSDDVAKLPRNEPFFFISCADDWVEETPATYLTRIPDHWIEMDEDYMITTTRPVSQFSADPDVRLGELKAWAIGHIDELIGCIPGYSVAPIEAPAPEIDEKAEA